MGWSALKHGLAALAAGTIQNHTALQQRVAEEAKTQRLLEAKMRYEAGLKAEDRQFQIDKMSMQEGMRTEREMAKAETAAAAAATERDFTSKENELTRLSREKAATISANRPRGASSEAKPARLEKIVDDETGTITWVDPTKGGIPVRTTDASGRRTIAEYDAKGNLIDPNETDDGEQLVRGIDDVVPKPAKPESKEAPKDAKKSGVVREVRSKEEVDAAMAKANELIAAGYDRKEVLERLRKLGITVKE